MEVPMFQDAVEMPIRCLEPWVGRITALEPLTVHWLLWPMTIIHPTHTRWVNAKETVILILTVKEPWNVFHWGMV